VNGDRVLVGSRRLMQEHGLDPAPLEAELVRLEEEAKTAMLVAVKGTLAGVVAVADTLKDDSVAAIQELHQMGLETAMITGDNQRTGEAIARRVGIDHDRHRHRHRHRHRSQRCDSGTWGVNWRRGGHQLEPGHFPQD